MWDWADGAQRVHRNADIGVRRNPTSQQMLPENLLDTVPNPDMMGFCSQGGYTLSGRKGYTEKRLDEM